jgi:hypothetical protein
MDKYKIVKRFLSVLGRRNIYSLSFLFMMWGFYTLFYYFGEIVDFFGWTSLRWEIFYTIHDAHRAVFLIPIVYAGYVFGVRTALTITLITYMTFLFRAILISPYPDALLRMTIFTSTAGAIGILVAVMRRESQKYKNLQTQLKIERDKFSNILERMEDGVLIIDSNYRIRFMNESMKKDFGDCNGVLCYKALYGFNNPCSDNCHLLKVLDGAVARRKYELPDGRIYEVQVSPFVDSDGTTCQLTMFRKTSLKGE